MGRPKKTTSEKAPYKANRASSNRIIAPDYGFNLNVMNAWRELRPHPEQQRLKESQSRFKIVVAGRRSGKTELAKRNLVLQALSYEGEDSDPRFFVCAPVHNQVKKIYWESLKAMVPPEFRSSKPSESELVIKLINGATIHLMGLDEPERIEGVAWNGGILDELDSMKPQVWKNHVRPALSDRLGWCWLVGVPEGRRTLYDLSIPAQADQTKTWDFFNWASADILPASEIEQARKDLDELTFKQEYEAKFVNFQGKAYYNFDILFHVKQLSYNPRNPLILCFDFNVDPGVAAIAQEQQLQSGEFGTGLIGEVYIPKNSNTVSVCKKIIQDWGSHEGIVICYGDATGGARKSCGVSGSDWDLIRSTLIPHFGPNRIYFDVPASNPSERSRLNAMNSRMMTTTKNIRFCVDPKCKNIIRDLDSVALLAGGSGEIDKKQNPELSHMCFSGDTLVETSLGIYKMDSIPERGFIRSWEGFFTEYKNGGKCLGIKEVIELTFSNGEKIECTTDHLFLTENGWVKAIDLLNKKIYSWLLYNNSKKENNKCKKKENSQFSMVKNIIGMADIISLEVKEFMSRYGNSFMEKLKMDSASIIKTITEKTTALIIFKNYLKKIMLKFMHWNQKELRLQEDLSGSNTLLMERENGIVPKSEKSFIQKSGRRHGQNQNTKKSNAEIAGIHSFQDARDQIFFSAQMHVRLKIAQKAEKIMSMQSASLVERILKQINICLGNTAPSNADLRVVKIKYSGIKKVYCPTIKTDGCFSLYSGIVVSNSDSIGYYVQRKFPVIKYEESTEPQYWK